MLYFCSLSGKKNHQTFHQKKGPKMFNSNVKLVGTILLVRDCMYGVS